MKKYTKTWERVVCDFINHNTARARCDINTFPYRGAGLLTSHLCPLTWAWDFTINLETFQIWFFGGLDSNDRRQAEWPEHNSGLFFWFSFFFCGKTEIMRKQPRSSLLINFPFLSSFPECYQSSHLHNQQVIAFSIANHWGDVNQPQWDITPHQSEWPLSEKSKQKLKQEKNKCWQKCGEKRTLVHC